MDVPSALIALGAAIALFKYKRNVMHVIAVCGLVGMAVHALQR
jgi:chromate transporter